MTLRRFQPISRFGQWSEIIRPVDFRTGLPLNLASSVLALGLYRQDDESRGWGRDYGWYGSPYACARAPVLSAVTAPTNTGIFRILPDMKSAQWTFPQSQVARLDTGSYLLVVTATIYDATDELLREQILVLPGGPRGPIVPPPFDFDSLAGNDQIPAGYDY